MTSDELAAWAGVVGAFIATAGLIFAGIQTRYTAKAMDLDNLLRLRVEMQTIESDLMQAYESLDPKKISITTNRVFNTLETLAAGVRHKLMPKVSRRFSTHFVVATIALMEHYTKHMHLQSNTVGEEFIEVARFAKENRKAINHHIAAFVKSDAKRKAESLVSG